MITGDHPLTAQAIARELGMLTDGRAVTGAELEAMDDDELDREVEHDPGLRPRVAGAQAARRHGASGAGATRSR